MVRMYADAYAVLGPGDIMLAGGAVCDTLTTNGELDAVYDRIGIERFQANRAQGELMLLPGLPVTPPNTEWKVTAIVAVTPNKVLVAAQTVLRDGRKIPLLRDGTATASAPRHRPSREA